MKELKELKLQYLENIRQKDKNNSEILNIKYANDVIDYENIKLKRIALDIYNKNIGRKAICETEGKSNINAECSFVQINENFEPIFYFSYGNIRVKNLISFVWGDETNE